MLKRSLICALLASSLALSACQDHATPSDKGTLEHLLQQTGKKLDETVKHLQTKTKTLTQPGGALDRLKKSVSKAQDKIRDMSKNKLEPATSTTAPDPDPANNQPAQ